MDFLYAILSNKLWLAFAPIIALGTGVAVVLRFFRPVSPQASFSTKLKHALLVVTITIICLVGIAGFIASSLKSSTATTPTRTTNTSSSSLKSAPTSTTSSTSPNKSTLISSHSSITPIPTTANASPGITGITPTPTTSALPGGFAPPPTWKQAVNDPLTANQNSGIWETDAGCTFLTNGYRITSAGYNYCAYGDSTHNRFTALAASVEVSLQQGQMAGLVFRLANNNYYAFYITATGSYQFSTHKPDNGGIDTTLTSGNSTAIHQGFGQKNTLAVIAQGTTLQCWINGQLVATQNDSTYTAGTIALTVGGDQNSTIIATFDHLQLWLPAS